MNKLLTLIIAVLCFIPSLLLWGLFYRWGWNNIVISFWSSAPEITLYQGMLLGLIKSFFSVGYGVHSALNRIRRSTDKKEPDLLAELIAMMILTPLTAWLFTWISFTVINLIA